MNANVYQGARVFLTGHTGFKGRRLMHLLNKLGAEVIGFSLPAHDIRSDALGPAIERAAPSIIFHLAAQAFVPVGLRLPRYTWGVNTLGTVNLLEAVRSRNRPCAVVVVTTDKVYGPSLDGTAHSEDSPLLGHCPYSASKVAAELAVASYRDTFFGGKTPHIRVATARAGNVIGPGDQGEGRLVPNAIRALSERRPIPLYNPNSVRPWQYVDDVLDGYLRLGAALAEEERGPSYCGAWNFGPDRSRTTQEVAERIVAAWGEGSWAVAPADLQHEACELRIDSIKARVLLGWEPKWDFDRMIAETTRWYKGS